MRTLPHASVMLLMLAAAAPPVASEPLAGDRQQGGAIETRMPLNAVAPESDPETGKAPDAAALNAAGADVVTIDGDAPQAPPAANRGTAIDATTVTGAKTLLNRDFDAPIPGHTPASVAADPPALDLPDGNQRDRAGGKAFGQGNPSAAGEARSEGEMNGRWSADDAIGGGEPGTQLGFDTGTLSGAAITLGAAIVSAQTLGGASGASGGVRAVTVTLPLSSGSAPIARMAPTTGR